MYSAIAVVVLLSVPNVLSAGMLFPRESESRQITDLSGMWNFRADMSVSRNEGFENKWYSKPLLESGPVIPMPVPSSFNDITTDRDLQYHVGWVWYEKEFFVSSDWQNRRVVLRFDSAHYYATAWINGKEVVSHEGGHLPFEAAINSFVNFSGPNRLTVAVNNTLTPHTLPPGTTSAQSDKHGFPPGFIIQNYQMDFFNYAGLQRRVRIYSTPSSYIDDITIKTDISGTTGTVHYSVVAAGTEGLMGGALISVDVIDMHGAIVATATGDHGDIQVNNAQLWWPFTMNKQDQAYLYTLQVTLKTDSSTDVYRQPFGIRTIRVTEKQFLINDKPFYCQGAAKHEDADIRGKGLDYPLIARDFNLLKWMGANCFRTSHYPYAEEIMDEADKQGIAVIDECPGVGIHNDENFSNASLAHHLDVMKELVRRDKNRPAVIMWSIANEPYSSNKLADYYFKEVSSLTKSLDDRPITFAMSESIHEDKAGKYLDVILLNRYYGWYSTTGFYEGVYTALTSELQGWYDFHHKPMMMSEYGADTVVGIHSLPSFVFSEEYQVEFLSQYHKAFDEMRKSFLVGEMVWNFADFMTENSITRVFGNRKGLFTRQRQPKMSAHLLRWRYWTLIGEIPGDLESPVPNTGSDTMLKFKAGEL